jgi:hypothetical protein
MAHVFASSHYLNFPIQRRGSTRQTINGIAVVRYVLAGVETPLSSDAEGGSTWRMIPFRALRQVDRNRY